METSVSHKAVPPNEKLYRPRLLAGMSQLHTSDVDPEADISITGGREVVAEIHESCDFAADLSKLRLLPTTIYNIFTLLFSLNHFS